MARLSKEELKALKKKYGDIYSYSKYNTYLNDPYSYYLNYVRHIKKDRPDNNFCAFGDTTHSLIEQGYENNWTPEEMLARFQNEAVKFELLDQKFMSSEKINANVESKYIPCVEHYIKNFAPLPYPFKIEEMIDTMVGKYYFYGYVDMSHTEPDGTAIITDFKTSTLYSKASIPDYSEQLLLYCKGYSEKYSLPIDKIKLRWDFVKYVNVSFTQENGKERIQAVLRCDLGDFLSRKVKTWATKAKYAEEKVAEFIEMALVGNHNNLPQDIQDRYDIQNCYVYIDFGQKDLDKLCEKIETTIDEASAKKFVYELTGDESVFMFEISDKEAFYFNNLCGYSSRLHKPYAEYIEKNKWRYR